MSERERYREDEYDEPEDFDVPEDEVDDLALDDDFSGADLAKREATRKPYRFRGAEGTVYTIPHPDLWSGRTQIALESGNLEAWALGVFEEAETAQDFVDEPMVVIRRAMDRIIEITEQTAKAGLNRGERRASARTSRSSRTNSKRR
ncbi:hypothetical protein [Streptomyces sp. NPDC001089]